MIFSLDKNWCCSGDIQCPWYGQAIPLVFTTNTGPHCPQESFTIHNQTPADDLQISRTQLNNNIEVLGDANFAGCHSTRKMHRGMCCDVQCPIREAWSKTIGVLALSSGGSELAVVVRAATEGMGLQSILKDLCLCGHVATQPQQS